MTEKDNTELQILKEVIQRVSKEVFGDGSEGLKTETIKLRQIIKLATWMVAIIGGIMVTDFAHRIYSVQPKNVLEKVEQIVERQQMVEHDVLTVLKQIRDK